VFAFHQRDRLKLGRQRYPSTDNVLYPETTEAVQQVIKDHARLKLLEQSTALTALPIVPITCLAPVK